MVGDARGNHKLTGMYGKFAEVNHVNHSFNCRWNQTDDETFKCTFVKQSQIEQYVPKVIVYWPNFTISAQYKKCI